MKTIKTIGIATLFLVGLTSTVSASIDKNLKFGQRDKEVTELQEFLIDKGLLKSTPSTFFGLLTFKAVKAYQANIGISQTGFVGALTREKINKEIENKVSIFYETEKSKPSVTINMPQENTQITTSVNLPAANNDSVYDSPTKMDKLGRKVTIIQEPNYKFLNIVKAKLEVLPGKMVEGFFYKDTKKFMTEEDLDYQSKITQDNIDKEFGRGAYSQSSTTQQKSQSLIKAISPSTAKFVQNTDFVNLTVSKNSPIVKIGSFTVNAGAAEDFPIVTQVAVTIKIVDENPVMSGQLKNLFLKYDAIQIGGGSLRNSTFAFVDNLSTGLNNEVSVLPNQMKNFDVYIDTGSATGKIQVIMTADIRGALSGTKQRISADGAIVTIE